MVPHDRASVLGKIALDVERALTLRKKTGAPGRTIPTPLAQGAGWSVEDVICTSGPTDRPFEEQHRWVSVAVVVSGTFEYRASAARELMTPGSLLLGNPGQFFECGHAHAAGDRCVAFRYAPEWFERLAAEAGVPRRARRFRASRVPPIKDSAAIVARASVGVSVPARESWEEIAQRVAVAAVGLSAGAPLRPGHPPAGALARTTDSVRRIERDPAAPWTLNRLAAEAALSPFHYLRTFQRVTGVTPHQFILRARLRAAALHLAANHAKVVDVASDAGFQDLSNFNHSFRAEFGVAPRAYRKAVGRR